MRGIRSKGLGGHAVEVDISASDDGGNGKLYRDTGLTSGGGNGIISISSNSHDRNIALEETISRCIHQDRAVFADDLRENFLKIRSEENKYHVALHGSPQSAQLYGIEIDEKILGNIIKSRNDYNNEEIVLISCNTGNEENVKICFAQKLANYMGVTVYTPTNYGAINEWGRYYSSNKLGCKHGSMKPFKPKKE